MFQVFVFMSFRCFRLMLQKWIWMLCMLLWLYTHVSNVSSDLVCLLQMFHLYVSKADVVLHMLQYALMAGGQQPAAAACCCCGGTGVVHVRVRDGGGRPGAAAGAPPWFTCGRKGAVPDAGAGCGWAWGARYDACRRRV
jgi:hypothetical protein